MKQQPMILRYDEIPPRAKEGTAFPTDEKLWEQISLPLGMGQMGACVFGYPDEERVQITENSLANPRMDFTSEGVGERYGLQNFAELYFDFGHRDVSDYRRSLSLDDAVASVSYTAGGVRYERTYFASHPAQTLVMRFSASQKGALSFRAKAVLPYLGEYMYLPKDACGRTGETFCEKNDTLVMRGEMLYYGILYEGLLCVANEGGRVRAEGDTLIVENADAAVLYFSAATNYRMESRVFTERDPKKKLSPYPHPHALLEDRVTAAQKKGFEALYQEHVADHGALFSRVKLSLSGEQTENTQTVTKLLADYKEGRESRYLEALLYAYGRYLLIASSRRGGLPSNLQGVWTVYKSSPWSCGYWHNVNVQMNYWHAGVANLSELFLSYSDYALAYMPLARRIADGYIAENYPENLSPEGENGWLVRTGAWQYTLDQNTSLGHSGPGTGAFTSLLFWDYYDYTRDETYLREVAYPILREMSLFFTKALIEKDGCLLVGRSASPENEHAGKYYHTVGCAFDQQMVYENFRRTLCAAEILGEQDAFLEKLKEMLPRLSPVLVGLDGQVKEYREEEHYGDIGEYEHRHISHLAGLYPGSVIHRGTPAWMDAACVTLTKRGDRSTGWALAHRLCLWARTGKGERVMALVRAMLRDKIMLNLWDTHPPFQIDGNFGYTAGVSEALLGSAGDVTLLIPSLPKEWENCAFEGLVARGNFEVDCTAKKGKATSFRILSRAGGTLKLSLENVSADVFTKNGAPVCPKDGVLTVQTERGDVIIGK